MSAKGSPSFKPDEAEPIGSNNEVAPGQMYAPVNNYAADKAEALKHTKLLQMFSVAGGRRKTRRRRKRKKRRSRRGGVPVAVITTLPQRPGGAGWSSFGIPELAPNGILEKAINKINEIIDAEGNWSADAHAPASAPVPGRYTRQQRATPAALAAARRSARPPLVRGSSAATSRRAMSAEDRRPTLGGQRRRRRRRRRQRGGQKPSYGLPGIGNESSLCGNYQTPDEAKFTPDKYITVPQIPGGSKGIFNANSISVNLAKTLTQAKANSEGDYSTAKSQYQDDGAKVGNLNLDNVQGMNPAAESIGKTFQDQQDARMLKMMVKHTTDLHPEPNKTAKGMASILRKRTSGLGRGGPGGIGNYFGPFGKTISSQPIKRGGRRRKRSRRKKWGANRRRKTRKKRRRRRRSRKKKHRRR